MNLQSVYIRFFSLQLLWLRSDYSLAITSFISALAPKTKVEQEIDAAQHVQTIRRGIACFFVTNLSFSKEATGDVAEMLV